MPYMMASRVSAKLSENLNQDKAPVWFEGIHTVGMLQKFPETFKNRKIFLRAHNIESRYYLELAEKEPLGLVQLYYKTESRRLHKYEQDCFSVFDHIFSISQSEQKEIATHNPSVSWLPAFVHYREQKISRLPPFDPEGLRVLYHGNFCVSENRNTAKSLLQVFQQMGDPRFQLILAGKGLSHQEFKSDSVEIHANPPSMDAIMDTVDLVVLPGKQMSGVKIKLLESLAAGKRVIASRETLTGSGLEEFVPVLPSCSSLPELLQKAFRYELDPIFLESLNAFRTLYNPRSGVKQIIEHLSA